MSKNDNSFERQILDFYGIDKISNILNRMSDNSSLKDAALTQIGFDIALKLTGISKEEMERKKNILQIELYAQLERDRNKKPSNNSVDNLTWVDKQPTKIFISKEIPTEYTKEAYDKLKWEQIK